MAWTVLRPDRVHVGSRGGRQRTTCSTEAGSFRGGIGDCNPVPQFPRQRVAKACRFSFLRYDSFGFWDVGLGYDLPTTWNTFGAGDHLTTSQQRRRIGPKSVSCTLSEFGWIFPPGPFATPAGTPTDKLLASIAITHDAYPLWHNNQPCAGSSAGAARRQRRGRPISPSACARNKDSGRGMSPYKANITR